MIKHLVAAGTAILFLAVSLPATSDATESNKSIAPANSSGPASISSKSSQTGAEEVPAEKRFSSSVGEVLFTHQKHIRERAIPCVDCHHQINAKKLSTPHPDYFKSSWINCKTCHFESEKAKQQVYACSACHQTNPKDITNETLSSKVVIHKKCWNCHDTGTGKEASQSCELCHSGKKSP